MISEMLTASRRLQLYDGGSWTRLGVIRELEEVGLDGDAATAALPVPEVRASQHYRQWFLQARHQVS